MKQALSSLGRIGVLYGGDSAERAISLKSGQQVLDALRELGLEAVAVDVHFDRNLFEQLADIDVAFIALHGRGGEDGMIQSVLEVLKIPYTGSGVAASAIAMDKLRTKWLWHGAGLPTPAFQAVAEEQQLDGLLEQLGGTVMVKPAHEGSSIGMSKVDNPQSLIDAFAKASQYDSEVLIEQWITGSEYTCAILGDQALPVIRLVTPNDFYDYEAKYQSNTTEYRVPCGLTPEQEQRLQQLSLQAFQAVGCEGWGRVDAMMDEAGQFWLLEVNTIPGMTDHSLVPMAAKAQGMTFENLVETILLNRKGAAIG